MKIMIFTVNYKSDDKLISFIESIHNAKKIENFTLEIHILDNSQKSKLELEKLEMELHKFPYSKFLYSDGTNSGYFGGIKLAQNLLDDSFDILIYCNPDIRLDVNFFLELDKKKKGIIAPAIISTLDGFDQNPKYNERLKISKLLRLKIIYSNIFTYCAFQFMARIKEIFEGFSSKRLNNIVLKSHKIYAPHGAIFIFTNVAFFMKIPEFGCFLFGEEIFIAEEARKVNQDIIYEPSIKVFDDRHASINLLSCSFVRKLYFKSINYLLKKYY